jgi:hypothetical protein
LGSRMICKGCGEANDSSLKYCGNCGSRQIRGIDAINLYFIIWFILLIPAYLIETVVVHSELTPGFFGVAAYISMASLDAMIVMTIIFHGSGIVEKLDRVLNL